MSRVLLLAIVLGFGTPGLADTLTAARLIRPQSIIGPADLGVLPQDIPGALKGDDDVVGMEARVTLYPGRPILVDHVGPPALIE